MSRLFALLAGVALLTAASAASAVTISGTLPVSAVVNPVCTIDMAGRQLAFGTYTPASAKPASVALAIRCTAGTAPTIAIQGGGAGRVMTSTSKSATLTYNALLSDGSVSADSISPVADSGGNVTARVDGTIPATQYVPAAADYADDMVINVTF
jgi:spore coat protein U-like protein